MLKNMTETLLEQKLDSMMDSPKYTGCKCQRCREDILAYALNRLPPQYVSTNTGKLYTKLQNYTDRFEFDILCQLAIAIKVVTAAPRHQEPGQETREP
ncbi:MAG: late competence development ComFB family protein [Peptococcaceae bacterium]|nr:late competence development ComFB family protein [Peptococcaceae bacterium]